jgi:hypothetical protein
MVEVKMSSELTDRQIEVAVEWWTERLKSPSFRTLSDCERRDPTQNAAGFAEMLAVLAHEEVETNKIDRFKEALRDVIGKNADHWLFLGVDYHPDYLLQQALDAAGIEFSMTVLPWKTGMHFSDGGVQVSEGYGTPYTEILLEAISDDNEF